MIKNIVDVLFTVLETVERAGLIKLFGIDPATLDAYLQKLQDIIDGLLP